jgi:hypothetical protein
MMWIKVQYIIYNLNDDFQVTVHLYIGLYLTLKKGAFWGGINICYFTGLN